MIALGDAALRYTDAAADTAPGPFKGSIGATIGTLPPIRCFDSNLPFGAIASPEDAPPGKFDGAFGTLRDAIIEAVTHFTRRAGRDAVLVELDFAALLDAGLLLYANAPASD